MRLVRRKKCGVWFLVVVSFLTQKPSEEVLAEFDKAAEK